MHRTYSWKLTTQLWFWMVTTFEKNHVLANIITSNSYWINSLNRGISIGLVLLWTVIWDWLSSVRLQPVSILKAISIFMLILIQLRFCSEMNIWEGLTVAKKNLPKTRLILIFLCLNRFISIYSSKKRSFFLFFSLSCQLV